MTLGGYRLLLWAAMPLVLLRLVWRARRQREYLQHVGERLGLHPAELVAAARAKPLLWLHAVSLGETRAAQPLVEALLARHPDHRLLLTHMTPTGRAEGWRLFGDRVLHAYLPYDTAAMMGRFLRRFQPRVAVLMETEVWPVLIARCHADGRPVVLASARFSERSARKAQRLGAIARQALGRLDAVACQTAADAERLAAAGAPAPVVTGNLKFDMTLDPAQLEAGRSLRAQLAQHQVLLFANAREGEESMLLDALRERPLPPGRLLLLVPRHPQRFDEVASLVRARGLSCVRRSEGRLPDAQTQVWLGDTLGEMPFYYALSDVAIIGGSFAPLGGHNLIEASAAGVPVVIGPHTFNFAQATEDALAAGAACRTQDMGEAWSQADALLQDGARRAAMHAATARFIDGHRGATARTLAVIEAQLARF
jgi:3-deoxy-D-manno-octulosonic-acid transferase